MKSYGIVKSTERPEPLVVDEFSAWESNNINEVSENLGTENEFVGFEFQLIQYDKDEYIKLQAEKGIALDLQITDLQLAVVEMHEGGLV